MVSGVLQPVVTLQGQRRHMKSGGAKNGNIASALELCWESIMKSIWVVHELKATSIL